MYRTLQGVSIGGLGYSYFYRLLERCTHTKQGAVHFSPFPLPELLNPIFFAQKTLTSFIIRGPKNFREGRRAHQAGPKKFRPSPKKILSLR